jgi:hypothetical protein
VLALLDRSRSRTRPPNPTRNRYAGVGLRIQTSLKGSPKLFINLGPKPRDQALARERTYSFHPTKRRRDRFVRRNAIQPQTPMNRRAIPVNKAILYLVAGSISEA